MKHSSAFIVIFIFLFINGCSVIGQLGQEKQPDFEDYLSYSDMITTDYLRSHLEVIAHDSLMGRNTATEGEDKAARYLIDHYKQLGIAPKGTGSTYKQPFMLNAERVDSLVYETFQVESGDTVSQDRSAVSESNPGNFLRRFGGSSPASGNIVFGGFGVNDPQRDVNHLDEELMKDKWVLIFEDMPAVVNGDTLFNPDITPNNRVGILFRQIDAAGVLVISDSSRQEYKQMAEIDASLLSKPENMRLQYLDDGSGGSSGFGKSYTQINPELAAEMIGMESVVELNAYREQLIEEITEFEPTPTSYHLDYTPYEGTIEVESKNVLAYIEGEDPELKEEVLVLMAHYDHVGISMPDENGDQINNGADDDGSGTTALLAVAEALQNAKIEGAGLDRSVLFLHVSAEEKGLLGSRYYSDHPVIPIEQTISAFNADMIGRSDPVHKEAGNTDYVYLIGGEIISSELDSLVQAGNEQSVNMTLDRRYNDLTDSNQFYRRSDHWNLGRLDVPFVFFFTGVHEDYHRPSDEVDKIEFEKYSRIVRLIYASTVKVANYEGRPEVDNQEFIEITRQRPR